MSKLPLFILLLTILLIIAIIITILYFTIGGGKKENFNKSELSEKIMNDKHAWSHAMTPFEEINLDLTNEIKDAYLLSGGKDPDGYPIDNLFQIDTILPCKRKSGNVAIFSLFAKCVNRRYTVNGFYDFEPEGKIYSQNSKILYNITEENLKKCKKKDGTMWDIYIEPLIKQLHYIYQNEKSYKARIYLAQDLKFLIPKLHNQSTEIYLMKHSSKAAHGMMWRFLPMDDKSLNIIILCDADNKSNELTNKIKLFNSFTNTSNMAILRHIVLCHPWNDYKYKDNKFVPKYKQNAPLMGGSIVVRPKLITKNIQNLLKDFIAYYIPNNIGRGFNYPYYGGDETFLSSIVYYTFFDTIYTFYKPLYNKCMNDEIYKKTIDVKDYFMNPDNWILKDNLN